MERRGNRPKRVPDDERRRSACQHRGRWRRCRSRPCPDRWRIGLAYNACLRVTENGDQGCFRERWAVNRLARTGCIVWCGTSLTPPERDGVRQARDSETPVRLKARSRAGRAPLVSSPSDSAHSGCASSVLARRLPPLVSILVRIGCIAAAYRVLAPSRVYRTVTQNKSTSRAQGKGAGELCYTQS